MRVARRLIGALVALARRRRAERELDDELRHFLDASIESKLACGMNRADAERAARLELGSPAAVKDWTRDAGWESCVESVWQDVRYAARSLRRSPGFALAAIATLAVGVGATSAMYAIVHAVLLAPLPYAGAERIREILLRDRDAGRWGVSAGLIAALRESPSVELAAGSVSTEATLTGGDVPLLVSGEAATEELFDLLGVEPLVGRTFGGGDAGGGPVVVLGYDLWRRAFAGRTDIAGRSVALDAVPHTVLGVMPQGFATPNGFRAEYWVLRPLPAGELATIGTGPYGGILKLREDDSTAAQAYGAALLPSSAAGDGLSLALVPLLDTVEEWYGRTLWSLLAAVGVVLLLCCGNVANLLLARSRTREHELAVRGAIGASRGRLVRQMITEAFVLAAPAAALGWLIAEALVRSIAWLPVPHLARPYDPVVDIRVLSFMGAVACATVLLFGVGPALAAARGAVMRAGDRTQTRRGMRRTTQMLIAFEMAATIALLAGAGLVGRRIAELVYPDAGFDTKDLRLASIRPTGPEYRGEALERFYLRVAARLRERTGLEAAIIDRVPLDMWRARQVKVAGKAHARSGAGLRVISPGALALLGAGMVRGRELTTADAASSASAVVNETLARRLWGDAMPLGEAVTLTIDDKPHVVRVVGIVRDLRDSLYRPPGPEIYAALSQFPPSRASIVFRTGRPDEQVTDAVRRAVMEVDPRQAVSSVTSITELTLMYTALSRFIGILLGLFAALASLLAATGVLAVASGAVASRRREIGIRVAVGATARHVLASLSKDIVPAIGAGAAAGLAAAVLLGGVLRSLVPGVPAFDFATYSAAAVTLALIALAGAALPARRALAVDPTIVLTD